MKGDDSVDLMICIASRLVKGEDYGNAMQHVEDGWIFHTSPERKTEFLCKKFGKCKNAPYQTSTKWPINVLR